MWQNVFISSLPSFYHFHFCWFSCSLLFCAPAFKAAVAAGDECLKSKKYEQAKANYEKAAEIKANDAYVMKKMEEVNKLLSYKKPSGIGKINEKDFNDE
ncbi:MAG: hypothetical protein WCP55_17045 [Lentisphaerota bacterium]